MKQLLSLIIIIQNSTSAFAQSGITWSMGMNIAANSYDNMHPRMSLNGAGQPMVVWGKMSDKSVQFTRWNGAAFTTPIKLNPAWMTVAGASWMGPGFLFLHHTMEVFHLMPQLSWQLLRIV